MKRGNPVLRFTLFFLLLIGAVLLAAGPLMAAEKEKTAVEPALTARVPMQQDYVIGPGDVLDIAVWKDEALTKSVVVRPDGKIAFPLVGEIMAGGKTPAELKKAMEARLDRYVPGVDLFVNVAQVNSMIVYVIGKVNTPGRQIVNSSVNVLQALATAGGLNVFARQKKIMIFRHAGKETLILNFDYDDVTDGKHLEQNILLKRGDVVVVP